MKSYVHLIDGIGVWVPVPVQELSNDEYLILDNDIFDLEDTTCLMQFIPGDVVKVKEGKAILLVSSAAPDRKYWKLLYDIVSENEPASGIQSEMNVIDQIAAEITNGTRRHYPAVVKWINNQNRV